jgi:large subunit ribosomal protein L24
MASKFKKNDQVIVISGSNKGKVGKILGVLGQKILIEGVNLVTIHKKPTNSSVGRIEKKERPIHISNISHIEDGKPIKIKFINDEGAKKSFGKYRVSKRSGKKIV